MEGAGEKDRGAENSSVASFREKFLHLWEWDKSWVYGEGLRASRWEKYSPLTTDIGLPDKWDNNTKQVIGASLKC